MDMQRVNELGKLFHTQRQQRNQGGFGPGAHVLHYLASVIDPEFVRFSEWYEDKTSDEQRRTGKAFLVTDVEVITMQYNGAPSERHNGLSYPTGSSDAGEAELPQLHIEIHPVDEEASFTIVSTHVVNDLSSTPAGSVHLSTRRWSVDLPFETVYNEGGVGAYVADLRHRLVAPLDRPHLSA